MRRNISSNYGLTMNTLRAIKIIIAIILLSSLTASKASGQYQFKSDNILTLKVKTFDSLILPAQVINPINHNKKMILFISGSTPYDEKGNQGAFWNDKGKMIIEEQEFYVRFLDIMSDKGFSIATMAKRSFVYPTKIPRPNFNDLSLDIQFFIEELKKTGLLKDEKDLVIVGYSEGSIVASKVLGILKKQPCACILLGSATLGCDCGSQSIEDFYMTDVLRRLKHWNDEQIKTEFAQLCQIREALLNMDEEEFENDLIRLNLATVSDLTTKRGLAYLICDYMQIGMPEWNAAKIEFNQDSRLYHFAKRKGSSYYYNYLRTLENALKADADYKERRAGVFIT